MGSFWFGLRTGWSVENFEMELLHGRSCSWWSWVCGSGFRFQVKSVCVCCMVLVMCMKWVWRGCGSLWVSWWVINWIETNEEEKKMWKNQRKKLLVNSNSPNQDSNCRPPDPMCCALNCLITLDLQLLLNLFLGKQSCTTV